LSGGSQILIGTGPAGCEHATGRAWVCGVGQDAPHAAAVEAELPLGSDTAPHEVEQGDHGVITSKARSAPAPRATG
jgi:hypothetical protein